MVLLVEVDTAIREDVTAKRFDAEGREGMQRTYSVLKTAAGELTDVEEMLRQKRRKVKR